MNECRAKYKSELDSDEVRDLGNNYISIFKKLAKKVGGDCLDFVNKSLKKLDNSRNRQRDYLKRVADILEENGWSSTCKDKDKTSAGTVDIRRSIWFNPWFRRATGKW